jgi:hypothetical protein
MQNTLIGLLYHYMQENNPEFLLELEEKEQVRNYLHEKVNGINSLLCELQNSLTPQTEVEEICLKALTADLRPSRFNYINSLLEEDFAQQYKSFIENNLLKTEAINLVNFCRSAFDDLQFSEVNEGNNFIRYAICGAINEYLESNSANETVSNELQQPPETEG